MIESPGKERRQAGGSPDWAVLLPAALAMVAALGGRAPEVHEANWSLLMEFASGVLAVLIMVFGYLYYRAGGEGPALLMGMAYLSPTIAATFLMVIAPLLLLVGDLGDVRIFSGMTGALAFSMLMTVGSAFARRPPRAGQGSLVGLTVGVALLSAAGSAGIMDLVAPGAGMVAEYRLTGPVMSSLVAGTGSAAVSVLCWRAGGRLNRRISMSQAIAAVGELAVVWSGKFAQALMWSRVSRLMAAISLLYAIFLESGDVLDEQKRLARESQAYRAAFDSVPIGVCSVGKNGRIETFNRMLQRVFSVTESDVVGRRIHQVVNGLSLDHVGSPPGGAAPDRALTGTPIEIAEGKRMMSGAAYPLVSGDGVASGVAIIVRDVTEQKRLEEELKRSGRLAIAGSVAQAVSTRLAGPLDRIKQGLFSCLAAADGEALEYLRLSVRELERLESLMRDLKFLQAPANLELQRVSLGEIAQQVVEIHRAAIARKGVVVNIRLAPGDEAFADRRRLQQVVTNVVKNALEAVKTGGSIDVETWVDPQRGRVGLSVRNSGSRILGEDIERVFEPFFSTKPSGTGLGLAVCKRIVEDHSGRISIVNEAAGVLCSIELPSYSPAH
ncbi:MAG: PAS domain S-box protein [Firmicutes bacterium]|nr:PAS domain S-box protein [Bacillota bacterium]